MSYERVKNDRIMTTTNTIYPCSSVTYSDTVSFDTIFSFICMFCGSLFVLLYGFFFWTLRCLFFIDVRILITPLVSSNSSQQSLESYIVARTNYVSQCYSNQETFRNKTMQNIWNQKIFLKMSKAKVISRFVSLK